MSDLFGSYLRHVSQHKETRSLHQQAITCCSVLMLFSFGTACFFFILSQVYLKKTGLK